MKGLEVQDIWGLLDTRTGKLVTEQYLFGFGKNIGVLFTTRDQARNEKKWLSKHTRSLRVVKLSVEVFLNEKRK